MVWKARDWVMYFMGNGYVQTDCGMFGGYPAATGYRLAVHETDLAERFSRGEVVPTGGDGDPENSKIDGSVKGRLIRDNRATTTPDIYEDYDLYLNYLRGGPGLGDPIERDVEAIERDLNEGTLLPRYARSIYGAVCSDDGTTGRWTVSENETAAERRAMRDRRLARARPVGEWMAEERQRILRRDASHQVREMYRSSMKMSERFEAEFREFWSLGDDWRMEEG
jgi:acetone carboxylase alpha subunit